MSTQQIYIAVSILALAVVALLVCFGLRNSQGNRLIPLAGFAFGFVIAGLLFSERLIISYSLTGVGLILAVIGLIAKAKGKGSGNTSGKTP